jgi:uncharacterized peroxidase-related enzyme
MLVDKENEDDFLEQVTEDYKKADISDKEKLMLYYTEKLTNNPSSVTEQDVKDLRVAGFSDRAINDINQVVSYFNYVNRIAEGLGINLEE